MLLEKRLRISFYLQVAPELAIEIIRTVKDL